MDKARDIQSGGTEYCHSAEWLDIFWPADEYILIKLCKEKKLHNFYQEAEQLLIDLMKSKFVDLPYELIHEAVEFNCNLIKLPFQAKDFEFKTQHNIWEFYQRALVGESIPLQVKPISNRIIKTKVVYNSWDEWCREVIWYGNKKGAYLYGNDPVELEISGHF